MGNYILKDGDKMKALTEYKIKNMVLKTEL